MFIKFTDFSKCCESLKLLIFEDTYFSITFENYGYIYLILYEWKFFDVEEFWHLQCYIFCWIQSFRNSFGRINLNLNIL